MIKETVRKIILFLIWKSSRVIDKRVFFSSFLGNSYSDNPKKISEALHEIDKNIEIVWLNNGSPLKGAPDYITQVSKTDFFKYYRYLSSSKVVVDNFSFFEIPKNKSQKYIQTWHGDRAFKKVLYDSPFVGKLIVQESKKGFCDLAIAGSDYGENQYRSAFRYEGEILKVGTPRDDDFININQETIEEMKKSIGLEDETKYLLYAPTIRRKSQYTREKQEMQGIDIKNTIEVLQEEYGGKWKCLLRAHPGVTGLTGVETKEDNIIDVSNHPDMADLLMVSDVLITDYSSCAGDFALLNRPIFLFQDDIEEYIKNDRTFYFDMDKSPYHIAHSQEDLEKLIKENTFESAKENCSEILDFYGTCETGESSKVLAQKILVYCFNM